MAGDFDLSDDDWEDSPTQRERKRLLKRVESMKVVTEYGQYEAGWNDALSRLAEWLRGRM